MKTQEEEHQLKILPKYFKQVKSNRKKFEVRKNDRDFQTGDFVSLNEFNPEKNSYSGNQIDIKITYLLTDSVEGIKKGFCVFCFEKI